MILVPNKELRNKNEALEKELVNKVKEVVNPDMIYVLGVIRHRRTIESSFCHDVYESEAPSSYLLLVLASLDPVSAIVQNQERIEQLCQNVLSTTCILLDTGTFMEWLSMEHQFAVTVVSSIEPIFILESITIEPTILKNNEQDSRELELRYQEGLNRYQAFIAGAELFRIRKEYRLSMFMLHQAAEQGLSAILKIGMGYYCCTHSIDRLFRYARFVCPKIDFVFPKDTETEKRQFGLLQRAYVDSRYNSEYVVNYKDLDIITSRVRSLYEILEKWGKEKVLRK